MFWDNFYSACLKKGTKPNPLAKELQIASGSMTAWKSGKLPNGETLLKIADYLNVSVDYLLGRTDNPNSNINNSYNQNGNNNFQTFGGMVELSKRDAELLQKVNSLDFSDYADIINYINEKLKNKG